jgi:hypothetical protein
MPRDRRLARAVLALHDAQDGSPSAVFAAIDAVLEYLYAVEEFLTRLQDPWRPDQNADDPPPMRDPVTPSRSR